MEEIKKVKKVYSIWARSYDKEKNPALIAESNLSVELSDIKPDEKVLDYGCGTGRTIREILSKTKNVYGVDISKDMINIAKRKYPNVKFVINKKNKLDFNPNYFDIVICNLVISHIKEINGLFNEMYKVLKKQGRIIITTIHPEAVFTDYKMKKRRFELMRKDINIQHSRDKIREELNKSGFINIETRDINITDKLKELYTPKSFNLIKGTPFLLLIKAERN